MKTVGISDEDQWSIFQVVAAVLHLGNVQFKGDPKAKVTTPENLQWASYLLEMEIRT